MNCEIRIMGIKGSHSCREIIEGTSIKRYFGNKNADALINYGLCGQKLRNYYKKYPSAREIPMINKFVGNSKYRVVCAAKDSGILVPHSRLELPASTDKSLWIEKRFNSQSGYGICKARGKRRIAGKYYQKFVKDRRSELRVHSFKWIDPDKWKVQRRHGKSGEIAWNFRNGGYFSSIYDPMRHKDCREAIDITKNVLSMLRMSFGAADFIIDENGKVYFIEINSCPGFQELSKNIYTNAFEILKGLSTKQVLKYCT